MRAYATTRHALHCASPVGLYGGELSGELNLRCATLSERDGEGEARQRHVALLKLAPGSNVHLTPVRDGGRLKELNVLHPPKEHLSVAAALLLGKEPYRRSTHQRGALKEFIIASPHRLTLSTPLPKRPLEHLKAGVVIKVKWIVKGGLLVFDLLISEPKHGFGGALKGVIKEGAKVVKAKPDVRSLAGLKWGGSLYAEVAVELLSAPQLNRRLKFLSARAPCARL
jgi:hypothetical protein